MPRPYHLGGSGRVRGGREGPAREAADARSPRAAQPVCGRRLFCHLGLGADSGMGVCAGTLEEATQSHAGNCPQQHQLIKGVVTMSVFG